MLNAVIVMNKVILVKLCCYFCSYFFRVFYRRENICIPNGRKGENIFLKMKNY